MDGWNTNFQLGWPICSGDMLVWGVYTFWGLLGTNGVYYPFIFFYDGNPFFNLHKIHCFFPVFEAGTKAIVVGYFDVEF